MLCFVCHEETTARCACACKAHAHPACLLKAVQACKSANCTICLAPITNVRLGNEHRLSLRVFCLALTLASATVIASVASVIFLARAVDSRKEDHQNQWLICCGSSVGVSLVASGFLQKLTRAQDLYTVHEVYRFI